MNIDKMSKTNINILNEIAENHKQKIIDKLVEDAILKNKTFEDISSKDIFDAEANIEIEKDEVRKQQELKKNYRNFIILTFAFSINAASIVYLNLLKGTYIDEYLSRILLIFPTIILFYLLINSMLQMKINRKQADISSPENLSWRIVKQWTEIEKIVGVTMNQDIITPIEVVKFIQTRDYLSDEEKKSIQSILKIRNNTVHGTTKVLTNTLELQKSERLAYEIVSKLTKNHLTTAST